MKKFLLKTRRALRMRTWKAPLGYTRKGWQYTKWKTVDKFETLIDACVKMKKLKQGLQQARIYFNGKEVADFENDEFKKISTNNPEHIKIINDYEKELRGSTI